MRVGPFQLLVAAGAAAVCVPARAQTAPRPEDGPVIVGESKSRWKAWDLRRFDAAVEFLGRSRVDTLKQDGQADIVDRETLLRELVEVSGEAYIGHKNLIDLTGTVRLGFEDRFLDSDTAGAEDHSGDFTNLFDVNAHVLGTSKAPLDVYARRDEQFLDRDFAASVTNTTLETGVAAAIQSIRAPTTLRLFRLESTQDDQLRQSSYELEQYSFAAHSTIHVADRHRLEVDFTYDDVSERQGTLFSSQYERQNLQLTDVINFGKSGLHELRSYLQYYGQTGQYEQSTLRWDERLLLVHSDRLETRYNALAERQTVGEADQDHFEGSAMVKHKLFDSLVSTGTVGGRKYSDSSDFSSTEWFTNGELEYTKKVPRGRLDVTAGASFSTQDNSARGGTQRVLDESQVFNDPFPITLARRHIVPGSVVVTAAAGFPTYQEGVAFTVQYFADRAEIRIIVGQGISDGDTLLVDYDVGPEPASTVGTTGLTASVRYSITEGALSGVSVYSIYRRLDHTVDSADPEALVFDDTVTFTYGAEIRRGGWHLKGEREHHESTVTPYTLMRLEGSYDHQFSRGSSVGVDASHELIDYSNPDNSVAFSRLTFRWNERITSSADVLLRIDLRDEHDDLRGDTQGIDQSLTLNWRRRQTTAYIALRNTLLTTGTSDRVTQFLEVGFRREF